MRILVPVDDSAGTRRAIEFLLESEGRFGPNAEIELANVQYSVPESLIRLFGMEEVKRYYLETGKSVFDKLAATTGVRRLGAVERVLYGDVGKCLTAEAEAFRPDLIVMGTRGLPPLEGLLLGSVSNALLARTRAPMLLLREGVALPAARMRVGVLVDGSEYGAAAAKFVLEHRALFGPDAILSVVHCAEPVPYPISPMAASPMTPVLSREELEAGQRSAWEENVRPILELFEKAGVPVRSEYLQGVPDKVLPEYASAALDLVVMGSHGYGNFTAAVLGSTAMHVAANCRAPVLVVRRPKTA